MPINITAVGAAGTHTLQKLNVNVDENFVYFPNRDSGTAYPSRITDDSAWVLREPIGALTGVDANTVYFLNSDGFSVQFSTTQGGSILPLTGFSPGSITLNFPFVFNNQFNISSVKFEDRQAVRYVTNGTPITGLTSGQTYYVRNLLSGLGGSSLYEFTTLNFTTGGATGRVGPTIAQVRAEYANAGNTWANTFINQGNFQGYQDWTVPEDGTYEFTVRGATGRQGAALGGGGAIVRGRVRLFRNEVITIAVGQRGELPSNNFAWPGSSGGSFVVRKSGNIPLFVAGGGSSSGSTNNGLNAALTIRGGTSTSTVAGGDLGQGAAGNVVGGGGGGFFSSGGNSTQGVGGGGFNNGLVGGSPPGVSSGSGGFGGGGSADGQAIGGSGGAGGYSGGAANIGVAGSRGGGGGSFIFANATNVATSTGLYNGSITLGGNTIANLNQFNTSGEGSVTVSLVESSVFGFTLHPSAASANANTDVIQAAPAGTAFHSLVPITLDDVNDTINTRTPHGFFSGQAVNYFDSVPGGLLNIGVAIPPPPLNVSTVYYTDVVNDYTFRLSSTPDPNFTTINLTSPSRVDAEGFRPAVVNTAVDSITIVNHSFLVNQPIRYNNGGGTNIAPLQNNATYYVRNVIDANRFTISQSLGGPVIDLTAPGTGTNHSFIFTVLNELEDSIYLPSHGYVSGQTVRYQKSRDFAILNVSAQTTTAGQRTVNTSSAHGFIVGQRITFDDFRRPNTATPTISVTQISTSGQTRTLFTAVSHNLQVGMYITVSGFTGTNASRFNGTFVVSGVPAGNQLTYTAEESVTFVTENVVGTPTMVRRSDLEYIENTRIVNISTFASSTTTRTITTFQPHLFQTGAVVTINIIHTNPELPRYFNGTYTITVTGTNTFTYTGVYQDPTNATNRDPSITIATTSPTTLSTVVREIVVATVPSSTQFTYIMPSSNIALTQETATGRVSATAVAVSNRQLLNRTIGEITTSINHGLSVGDRFRLSNLTGNNQDVFNGSYQVTSIPSGTVVRFTATPTRKNVSTKRLDTNTSARINLAAPHNLVASNLFYLEGVSGSDTRFWDGNTNIISRFSSGTTRTINTDNPHYLSVNSRFRILSMSGENSSEYIGDWIVATAPSATQITFTAVNSLNQTQETVEGLLTRAQTVSSVPSFSILSRSKATGGLADITFTGNHDLVAGELVRITNIGGTFPDEFNGDFLIASVPAANRITYNTAFSTARTSEAVGGTATAANQIRYTIPTFTRNVTRRQLVSNTVALFQTEFEHQLATGSTVTLSGFAGNQATVFNGTYTVASIPSFNQFTVTRPQTSGVTTFTITNRQRTLNVCEITIGAGHGNNIQVGNTITISGITGSDATVFNGTHVVSAVPSGTTFQFFSLSSGTITPLSVTGTVNLDIVPDTAVSGTSLTLNTVPQTNTSAGTLSIAQVDPAGASGEFNINTEVPGLRNQNTYFVSRSDANTIRLANDRNLSQIADITGVGIGTHQIITTSIDYVSDSITIPNHGFTSGELVEYDTAGQTAISPLSSGTPYYVIVVDGNTIKLATSATNSENGVAVDLTTATTPTGRHRLRSLIRTPDGTYTITNVPTSTTFEVTASGSVPAITKSFNPRTNLNIDQNYIRVVNHGFLTGTPVVYSNGGGTSIGGLTNSTTYFVIVINKDHLRLASTADNADTGTAVAVTTFGAGGTHSLTSSQINGRVTGTGTVSTTVDSVLVNGSGTQFSKILKVGDQFRLFPPDIEQISFFQSAGVTTGSDQITVPNHGLTTGESIIYSPGTGGPRRNIFRLTSSGTLRTIRTAEPHGYSTTDIVTISGLSSPSTAEFNGTFSITVIDAFQFSYTASTGNSLTLNNENQTSGVANRVGVAGVAPSPLIDGFNYFVRAIPNSSIFSITTRDRTSNVITFTTSVAHNLFPGNTFVVTSMTGSNPEVFNGIFTVASVPATNQIQAISVGGDIGSAGASGTLIAGTSNTLRLFNSRTDAINDTNVVDILSQGTGFAHRLTKVVPVQPIVRRITAIGSDTQITVDRPFSVAYTAVNYSYPTFIYVRPQGYALHRPFDGGVEMSTGFGVWNGQIVRQTRKYFRYQSGKGIQTSAGMNFKPSIDIESLTRVGTSQTVAARTRRPHGLQNGLFCRIDDAFDSQGIPSTVYNGTFQVSVQDAFNFTFIAPNNIVENRAYGYPRLHVTAWTNGALRAGMFDFQNGMFFEFDGQELYAVRRSSTQQIAGTCAALQGSELVFGTNTSFTTQLEVGDFIVLRGQTYRVAEVASDTRIAVRPEFKGSSGIEKEFVPGNGVSGVVQVANSYFNLLQHGFTQNLPVIYNSIDGTPIGGLISGKTYYVDVVDNNRFRLKGSPDSNQTVTITSPGTGSPHSFTPSRTGMIATLTEDTRVAQGNWSLDPCDGTGPTGYNLDLSKIQMVYMDYSWYGAGKIRYGFKTTDGQVRYVHEFVHNNQKFESYFRSGNLPARYEVATFNNPTYIPSLFHWGTSVIMDGKFDDDRAYLFTRSSQNLAITGTTIKTFGSTAIGASSASGTDLISIPSHGFATGDPVQFRGSGVGGLPQANTSNPATEQIAGIYTTNNLTNDTTYFVNAITPNIVALFARAADATATPLTIQSISKSAGVVSVTTTTNHGFSTGDLVLTSLPNAPISAQNSMGAAARITSTGATTYTYTTTAGLTSVTSISGPALTGSVVLRNPINFLTQGSTQSVYSLAPAGTLNNTSGLNYQPLLSLRLSPSVSEGLTGSLGDRDVINRMQLRLIEIGVATNQLVDVRLLLNARLNNLNFVGVSNPSLVQTIDHTSNDTVSGGIQVYNFRASGGAGGVEATTTVNVDELFELSNSILGGSSVFPDGPDIVTVAVSRLTGNSTLSSARMSWKEAQA
jgi:hypothetical protein